MSSTTAAQLAQTVDAVDEESHKIIKEVIKKLSQPRKAQSRGIHCTSPTWCDSSRDCWGCWYNEDGGVDNDK